MRIIDSSQVLSYGFTAAAEAISACLRNGFDPASDPARQSLPTAHGSLLLMPSQLASVQPAGSTDKPGAESLSEPGAESLSSVAGLKVLGLAPANPEAGLPLIQGSYLLFEGRTLTPVALLDGAALTTLRTPALSLAAAAPFLEQIAQKKHAPSVVIFGAGPQGVGHLRALKEQLRELGLGAAPEVSMIVRRPEAVSAEDLDGACLLTAGSPQALDALSRAQIVVCATGAAEPLFHADQVRPDVLVIALGSHTPEAREVPGALMGRAQVVVEDRDAALREAGDVVLAIAEGELRAESLVTMAELLAGKGTVARDLATGPVVVKTVGMGWEDLAVARAVFERSAAPGA